MTRSEIIQSIKDAWARELMDVKDLREDMADSYAAWVKGLIKAAAPELSGKAGDEAMQEEGAQGEAAPAGAQGAEAGALPSQGEEASAAAETEDMAEGGGT